MAFTGVLPSSPNQSSELCTLRAMLVVDATGAIRSARSLKKRSRCGIRNGSMDRCGIRCWLKERSELLLSCASLPVSCLVEIGRLRFLLPALWKCNNRCEVLCIDVLVSKKENQNQLQPEITQTQLTEIERTPTTWRL